MQPRLSRFLEACADVRSVLDCVLNLSLNFVEADFGNVQLVDWKSGCLEIKAQSGFGDEFLNFFERVKLQDGTACARALRNRDAIIIEDVTLDPQFAPCRERDHSFASTYRHAGNPVQLDEWLYGGDC